MKDILVVDFEATCWSPRRDAGNQKSEIIEIGATKLLVGEELYSWEGLPTLLVQPRYSTVSSFCTDLTGLHQERLDKEGILFEEAMERLASYAGPIKTWASFGEQDPIQLERQCRAFDVPNPLEGKHHINIRDLLFIFDQHTSLSKALGRLGLIFEGNKHNAGDDALNAARVLGEMILKYRSDEIKWRQLPF